jgi:endonuclease/exonuclease/phosphatase family metal-dependent hydrolase
VKFMQINLWSGRIQRPILKLIEQEAPDVIFAQEVMSYPGEIHHSSPWYSWRTPQLMAESGKLGHTFFSPSTTYAMFDHKLSYGNAIFAKYPLSLTSTHYTGGSGPEHFDQPSAVDHNTTRNFQHAIIEMDGKKLNLINHHGHWMNQPLGNETSIERLQLLADFIATLEGPIVMAGDLNLSPDSPAIQHFLDATQLVDVATRRGATTLSKAHYVDRPVICDYILISPELALNDVQIIDAVVSDHKAIVAQISS